MCIARLLGVVCAGALAFVLSQTGQAASLILQGSVSACESTDFSCPEPNGFNLSGATMLSDSATLTRNDQLDHTADISVAVVDYGRFRAAVSTDTAGSLAAGGNSTAGVFGRSDDQITITPSNPALLNTLGTMRFMVEVSGSLAASESSATEAYADAYWSMSVSTDFGNPAFVSAQLGTAPYFTSYGDASGNVYLMTLPVSFGSAQSLILGYEVQSQAWKLAGPTSGSASAAAQFGNTFRWLGIESVLDNTGTPVDFSVTSDSGVNWAQAATIVPLPAAVWLFCSGLLGLIGIARRKRTA